VQKFTLNYKFPDGFLWGTTTAAHQVEGHDTKSDWWGWEKRKKSIPDTAKAIDEYHLYEKDISLMREELNNNSARFSLDWSRIFPEENKVNSEAVEHYKNVLKDLKKHRMKTIVTLHHFTNPKWFADKGGWEKRENVDHFLRYVDLCIKEYSEFVDFWIILNEPNVYSTMSYLIGMWPPEKYSLISTIRVYRNFALAHTETYSKIHAKVPGAVVGSSINMVWYKGRSIPEQWFSKIAAYIYNFSFIELTKGSWDFIGINYYYLHFVRSKDLFSLKHVTRSSLPAVYAGLRGDVMWPNYPEGMFLITQAIWNRYKKPIMITENGLANDNDKIRKNFILNNLIWLNRSIQRGAKILGYFYWSFADNIEWSLGEKIRFGLYEINYRTMKRTKRESAEVYAKIAKDNSIVI
jgi:beta-glucosidase